MITFKEDRQQIWNEAKKRLEPVLKDGEFLVEKKDGSYLIIQK